jgi:hypothetical protein
LVEQRTENPRVAGSIPALGTTSAPACSTAARRPHQGRGKNSRTPAKAFIEGLPNPASQKEVTPKPNQPKLKAA